MDSDPNHNVGCMGGATGPNRGVWGGTMSPHFWDQRGTEGTGGGPMKMIFASIQQTVFTLFSTIQMTEFQLH